MVGVSGESLGDPSARAFEVFLEVSQVFEVEMFLKVSLNLYSIDGQELEKLSFGVSSTLLSELSCMVVSC